MRKNQISLTIERYDENMDKAGVYADANVLEEALYLMLDEIRANYRRADSMQAFLKKIAEAGSKPPIFGTSTFKLQS